MKNVLPGDIEIRGKKIHYEFIYPWKIAEEGRLLVFLHEGLGSIKQWKDFPSLLCEATGLPALIYDRYGHGQSETLREPRYPRFLHDEALVWLPKLFGKLGLEQVRKILVGHSDGGSIALIYAAEHGKHLDGMIVEAAHVLIEPLTVGGIQQVAKEFTQGKGRELLQRYHGEKTDFLVKSWTENWMSIEAGNWSIEEYLPMITCPVLAVQGEDDHFGTMAQLNSISGNISGPVEVFLVPGCGHIPHQQAKDKVLKKMAGFIKGLSSS